MEASAYALAGIMFIVTVTTIVGSLIAGVLIDRFGPRKVLAYGELLFFPTAIALVFAQTLPQLAILVGVWSLVGAPVATAGESFAPYLADDTDGLRRVNAALQGAAALSFAVGPAIGALLVRFANVDWVFAFDAVTSLAAGVLVFATSVTPPERSREATRRSPFAETIEGVRVVYRRRGLRYYVLAGTAVWVAFGAFGALEPLFFRDVVGTDIEAMSWMNAIFGTGFFAGAAILPRLPRKVVSARGLALFVGLIGLGTVLYVGWPDLRVIAVGAFLWSLLIGTMEPLLRTLLHRDSPHELVGRVTGVARVHHHAGEILPLAFAPALAAAFGVQATLIGLGLFATIAAVATIGEARRIDRETLRRGVPEVEPEGIRAADEPLRPSP